MLQYLFGEGTDTPTAQQLAQKRAQIEAMQARQLGSQPRDVGEGIRAIGSALFARIGDRRLAPREAAETQRSTEAFQQILSGLGGMPSAPMATPVAAPAPAPAPVAPTPPLGASVPPVATSPLPPADFPPEIAAAVDRVSPPVAPPVAPPPVAAPPVLDATISSMNAPAPALSPEFEAVRPGIFAGESGGDYDALFGFSNRPGGPFENVRLTDMTVGEAVAFSDPSGPYGQWVKGQVGRVATPMGAYQVVGTTLRAAMEGLGLSGNEQMTPELQDQIGQWIFENQGTGAWEGYRPGVTDMPTGGGGNYSGPGLTEVSRSTMGGAAPSGGANMQIIMQLAELAGNPYLPEGQRMIAQMLIQQQVGQAFAPPPSQMDQIELERAQLELEQLRNPAQDQPDLPTSVEEYNFYVQDQTARGQVPLSYAEFNVMEAQAGNPALVQRQQEQQEQQANIVVGAIDDIMANLDSGFGLPEVGIVGSKLADWGMNQQAVDVREQLKTVQGAVAFDQLQAMREASPTGGALGAVSDTEMGLLASSLGALSNVQSEAALKSTLATIRDIMAKFATYPGEGNGGTGTGPTDQELLDMYGAP